MYPARDLYTMVVPPEHEMADGVAPGIVLIHGLTGFLDAGGGGRLAVRHILATLPHRPVAYFHVDGFYDYRGRRPRTIFDSNHYESMELPHLTLTEVTDAAGQPFLILHGVEPDLGWQSIVRSIVDLVRQYGVRLSVGMHAVPWPAPHTRPIEITAHSSDPTLLAIHQPWVGRIEIPGSLDALLELNLGQAKLPAMGYAAHVPHYLANTDYPKAALALLDQVCNSTGLVIPREDLRQAARDVDADVDAQIAAVDDNRDVVAALEAQHDSLMMSRRELTATPDGSLVSGEEIAASLEKYLADLNEGKAEE